MTAAWARRSSKFSTVTTRFGKFGPFERPKFPLPGLNASLIRHNVIFGDAMDEFDQREMRGDADIMSRIFAVFTGVIGAICYGVHAGWFG